MRFIFKTVKRLLLAVLLAGSFMVGGILATHFWMRLKFHALMQKGIPEGPYMDVPADRSMSDITGSLREVPFKGPAGTIPGLARGAAMNSFLLLLNANRATSGIMYPYPEEFENVVIESFDGTPLTCAVGIHKDGYADAGRMVEHISTRPPVTDQFFPVYLGFRLMHKIRREDMKGYIEDPEQRSYLDAGFNEADFTTYIDKIAAPHYGVSTEEFFANASPKNFLADVEVPLLIVHAEDYPICPASEMDELSEIAADNPNVEIWMMPAGNHCLFRYLDKAWYDKVMRDFFTYWATW